MHLNVSTILHIDFISIRESAVVKYLNIPVFLYLGLEWISAEAYSGAMGAQPPSSGLESMDFSPEEQKSLSPILEKFLTTPLDLKITKIILIEDPGCRFNSFLMISHLLDKNN